MGPPQENSEPSIEEILDSIRQIIADDEEGGEVETITPSPAPPPAQKVPSAKPKDDDIIELRDRVDEPVARSAPLPPPPPPVREPEKTVHVEMQDPEPEPYQPMSTNNDIEAIISKHAEAATVKAFSELTQRVNIEKGGNITVEDVVRYEIRPLLRAWIDKYLPSIVERLLQKELEKISSRFDQD
jgi:uncharacterized protein